MSTSTPLIPRLLICFLLALSLLLSGNAQAEPHAFTAPSATLQMAKPSPHEQLGLTGVRPQPEEYLMLQTAMDSQKPSPLFQQLQFEGLLHQLLSGHSSGPVGLIGPNGRLLMPYATTP